MAITKNKHEQIVSAVVGFIIEGHSQRDIEEWTSAQGEKDSSKTYKDACDMILSAYRTDYQYNGAFIMTGMKEMYRRMVEIGDYSEAAKILALLHKITK